jgi:hypothetical protein
MSDYFDHVEQGLRRAVREGAHLPWYARLARRRARSGLLAAVILVGGGTAIAATGVLRTGSPVLSEVAPTQGAYEGAVIPSSVELLPLRVADPAGGPPWGLRVMRTTRGLLCVQPGRVLGGRLGVIGEDGAFGDDGAFHPLADGYLSGRGCGTEDARGDAFVTEQLHGIPAGGLQDDRRYTAGGCYRASTRAGACPPADLRTLYYGMLGPDALSIEHRNAGGGSEASATVAPYGAYLIVLPFTPGPVCNPLYCTSGSGSFSTGSPQLRLDSVITEVSYTGAPPCKARAATETGDAAEELRAYREEECPSVGYVAPAGSQRRLTAAQLSAHVTARVQRAQHYCGRGAEIVACSHGIPPGYRLVNMIGPPEVLLTVRFRARAAVTNFDSHYEIETSAPLTRSGHALPGGCGGGFGPTQTNLRAGQEVDYTTFVNARCRGPMRVTVGYVTVDGPSGSMPVPGLPGQSAAIPVGSSSVMIP